MPAEPAGSQEVTDRYEQMLVRTPQTGTAFDRVVDWYATTSGPAALQRRWEEAAGRDPATRRSYLILQGLLAQRQGTAAEARKYFQEALTLEGDKVQAARPLAALEATEGNFPAAAAAYATALSSDSLKPPDRLDLMRSLALLHQRAFDSDKALSVWREAVEKFPGDAFVLEEAGEAFLAAGGHEDARKSFSRQRELATDPFQKIAASLRIARTLELEGKVPEAVSIYESALEETSGGSWINREVRGQIEALFRRKDDLPGLLAFYEKRMKSAPQDYVTLLAQAGVLEDLGRTAEAVTCTRAAAKLAPDDSTLRLALIRLLVAQNQLPEALEEASALAKPTNATALALVTLGNLHWKIHEQNPDATARTAALEAWHRLAPAESTDVPRIAQLAEILGSHGLPDEAAAQWQRIVTLSPDLPEPRQRLAEIFLKRGDKQDAAQVLAGMVEGERAQPPNFITLARLQERLEMAEAARATTARGLELFPQNFDLLSLAWRQALDANDAKAVDVLFPNLWANAPGDFAASEAEKKYAAFLEASGTGRDTLRTLNDALEKGAVAPDQVALLFRLALAQNDEATARKSLANIQGANDAVRAARAGYDFAQAFGSTDDQIAALQGIAEADPRLATESLRTVARLQAEAGKADAALATLSGLIERSPGDVSLYTLHADIATRTGKIGEAISRLNKAILQVDDTTTLRLQLAALLEVQGRTADAEKVLQEAFEQEQAEPRRMEVFRRQVETALRAGSIDDLIASLREKQLREQSGGRYGTYLAEIFMAQGDLLAAREELTRSLGRTPDNPAAISRLIDLAERGGDQEESLRLAKKLAELAPSTQNRSALLSKLFDAGEQAAGLEELSRVRGEILKDPKGWSGVLLSMRKAGLSAESDALVADIVVSSGGGILQNAEMARLRLMQRDYASAEKILWQILESDGLAASLAAVAGDTSSSPFPGYPQAWMQSFQILGAEAQNSLQQMFTSSRGYFPSMGFGASASQVTPEQREQVRSLFLLQFLAEARRENETFTTRLRKLLADLNLPSRVRLMALRAVNDTGGTNALIEEHADDAAADLETDRLIVTMGTDPSLEKSLAKIRERLAVKDPKAGFEKVLQDLMSELGKRPPGSKPPEASEYRKALERLVAHPGFGEIPLGKIQVASLAAQAGDFALAFRLCDEAEAEIARLGTTSAMRQGFHIPSPRSGILALALAADDPLAATELEKFLKAPAKTGGATIYYSPYGMGFSRAPSPLAQPTGDLAAGDADFPLATFRALSSMPADSPQGVKIRKWFADRASTTELTPATVGLFYADWISGKRDDATKRLEALHAGNPSARSAALLFEVYEKQNQPEKALALQSQAMLQPGETSDIRSLRVIRLLRAAGKKDEARTAAERLARSRTSLPVREQLANELNALGVPPTAYQNLTASSMGRMMPRRDNSEPLRQQVSKLMTEKKTDEAESIALQFLQRPLPSPQDYQKLNTRQNMASLLKSMGRLDRLQETLQARLEKNPADLDAAVRLAEAEMPEDSGRSVVKLAKFLTSHPRRDPALEYAFYLLRRSGDSRPEAADALCALIRADPEVLSASGMQMHDLMNLLSESEAGLLVADTIAGMNDENFARFFLASRLSREASESAILGQLAELSARAGKTDQAIALLQRTRPEALKNLDAGLPTLLRLTELQLEKGDKAAATETMKTLISNGTARPGIYGFGNQNLAGTFLNLIANRQSQGLGTDLILRTAKVADLTGTLDLLLGSLDNKNYSHFGATPSLLVRTVLKQPNVAKEWRTIALSEDARGGTLNAFLLPFIIPALANEKDAAKLIPALLRKIPDTQQIYGADSALSTLAETLPVLAKYRSDPAISRFVTKLAAQALADPNGSRYLIHSQNYARGLGALLEHGFPEDARKLFEFTAAERATGNFGNRPELENIERRLLADKGDLTQIDVVCTALPGKAGRLQIRWQISPVTGGSSENNTPVTAVWNDSPFALPKSLRPAELEIFAGPNPGALERIARVAGPEATGSVETPTTIPLGLLQARWKLPDGSTGAGSLTTYVMGENLLPASGVPDPKSSSASAFKEGLPGPNGAKSAVRYETLSAAPQASVPIASHDLEGQPETLVFSGWVAGQSQGAAPRLEIRWTHEDGRTDRRGSNYYSSTQGQWRQTFKIWTIGEAYPGGENIPKTVRKISLSFALQATSGYNGQWPVTGMWDGLQWVRLKGIDSSAQVSKSLTAFREAMQKKDFPAAADAFLEALRTDPHAALQQSPATIVEVFQKSNRLPELFTQVSAPALLLPNPLRNNQPSLNNPGLIALLVNESFAPGAPPAAKAWLTRVSNSPLTEELRFIIDAAALREAGARDPAKAGPAEVLATLGFRKDGILKDRIRLLWYFEQQGKPTSALLKLLDDDQKAAETLALLQPLQVPVELSASKVFLEAWLTAPSDPEKALTLWNQAVDLRQGGRSNVTLENAAHRALLLRVAARHPQPGSLVAAINTWLAKARPDGRDHQRILVELLHDAAAADSPHRPAYAALWADAELAALKTPGYNASRDRVRELAFRLMENAEWDRLENLLDASKSVASLANDSLQQEFTQLRKLTAFARGQLDIAWPVLWASPGKEPREVTAGWQWNIKDIAPDRGDFDTATSVAEKPLLPEIPEQRSVEVFFGEQPATMALLGKVDGPAAQGSLAVTLPAAHGFLRAVAVFDDKRVPGPLTVVNSGRRVYPPEGTSLKDLLLSGSEPLTPELIADAGTAPDGSPALRLGKPEERRRLKFNGPDFPVTPGKFYVLRGWLRRAGSGSVTASSEFKPIKGSTKGSLNMLLSEQQESTGQWVLYTRAVPVLDQYTFWIPMDEVATMTPRLWDLDTGTEIAGFELIEIEDWKYAESITELVLLRKKAADAPDAAALDRAITLASVEPLTAMDYHGDWLARFLPGAGRENELLDLYRKALSAEASPLYSRPKLGRIFDSLLGVLHRGEGSPEFRGNLAALVLESPTRTSPAQRVAALAYDISLAPSPEKRTEMARAAKEEITEKIRKTDGANAYLKALINARTGRGDRPVNELLNLLLLLNDPETSTLFLKEIQGKTGDGIALNDKIFATLALEAAQPDAKPGDTWNAQITRGFAATEKSNAPDSYMRWPFILADLLTARKLAPETVTSLRKQSLDRVLAAKPEDNGRTAETIRAAAFLLEDGKGDAQEITAAILPVIKAASGKLSEGSLRLILQMVTLLTASGANEQATALVNAAEPDIRRFPKMTADFAKHLPAGSPAP